MPVEINFGSNHKITYLYDAGGRKLSKQVFENNSLISSIDYTGGYIYVNNHLQMVMTPEGRLVCNNDRFDYQYFLKDHLGNIRVVFHEGPNNHKATIVQEDHFDPYGMKLGGLSAASDGVNKNLYQGKEFQNDGFDLDNDPDKTIDFYLNWYDFEARFYDPELGRWHVPDPAGQDASPYVAMGNNPVSGVDPDGRMCEGFWNLSSWRRETFYKSSTSGERDLYYGSEAYYEDFSNQSREFIPDPCYADYHGGARNSIEEMIWGSSEYKMVSL